VVGLGKSIIASAIAHNLGYKTIIIAPPHLENQWKDYTAEFDFKGHIYSTGKIEEALQRHGEDESKLLIILRRST
jgi:superfamily II DNA or RNA helicase